MATRPELADSPELPEYFRKRQAGGQIVVAGRLTLFARIWRGARAEVEAGTPKFDLDTYIANYSGRTRFDRLCLIGCSSPFLSVEALKAAIEVAKKGRDVSDYQRAVSMLQEITPGEQEATLDAVWIDRTTARVKAETDRLELELKGYKNNLIKESIRMGNEDLGAHYQAIGEPSLAFKAYSRMRDYCTSPRHISEMCMRLILVSIEQSNWLAVQSNVLKIRNLQLKNEDRAEIEPRLHAAMGLAQLSSGNFRDAADSFIKVDAAMGDSFNQVLTATDVAAYGGLCALASYDRQELQSKVLEDSNFRTFLELEPQLRRAISFFCSSKYSQCLEIVTAYRNDYSLDLWLQRHVGQLFAGIRTKSIIQYLVPFSCVTLESMAKAFSSSEPQIEDELVGLIEQKKLEARIDIQNKLLVAEQRHLRTDVHSGALEMARQYERTVRLRLMRMNIITAGLEVKGGKAASVAYPDLLSASPQLGRRTGAGFGE